MENNLTNPKAKGIHQKRVKKAIIDAFFPPYTTNLKISDTVRAWFTCGQVQIYENNVLIRNI